MQTRGEERTVTNGRPRRQGFGRQLIGWIAAYAFVLHAVLAGAVDVQIAATAAAPGFELCLSHPDGSTSPAEGQHQHDLCALHCAAIVGFAALALALIAFTFPLRSIVYARRRSISPAIGFHRRAG